jgi:hypothetical protein
MNSQMMLHHLRGLADAHLAMVLWHSRHRQQLVALVEEAAALCGSLAPSAVRITVPELGQLARPHLISKAVDFAALHPNGLNSSIVLRDLLLESTPGTAVQLTAATFTAIAPLLCRWLEDGECPRRLWSAYCMLTEGLAVHLASLTPQAVKKIAAALSTLRAHPMAVRLLVREFVQRCPSPRVSSAADLEAEVERLLRHLLAAATHGSSSSPSARRRPMGDLGSNGWGSAPCRR